MSKENNNREFNFLISDILENKEFNKLNSIEHHGISRYDHSMRVAYYSYKITKFLRLNYKSTARAGLLHDFFISKEDRTIKDRFISTFVHPKYSLETSKKYFELTNLEEDIIESHMFPIYKKVPVYAESWIVSLVDKISACYEFGVSLSTRLSYSTNLLIILILSNFK